MREISGDPGREGGDVEHVVLLRAARDGSPRQGCRDRAESHATRIGPGGSPSSLPSSDEPADLRSARTSIAGGQLENALKQLKRIDNASIPRTIIAAEVDFYIAYCSAKLALSGIGDKNAAAVLVANFRTTHAQSFHYFEATQLQSSAVWTPPASSSPRVLSWKTTWRVWPMPISFSIPSDTTRAQPRHARKWPDCRF